MVTLSANQLAYIAGIIDSDGSMSMSYKKTKNGHARYYQLRISTKDKLIVPTISGWLGVSFKTDNRNMLCIELTSAQKIKDILIQVHPYLYTKQPRAQLMIDAISIKNGEDSKYTINQDKQWNSYKEELNRLNGYGIKQPNDDYHRNHSFHWAWVAGLTDGDGSFPVCTWTKTNKSKVMKPSYQISMRHKSTMDYLSHILSQSHRITNDRRKNRNIKYTIRLMSQKLMNIVPNFSQYLVFKKERAECAIKAIQLRSSTPNGVNNHPNLVEAMRLIDVIKLQNQNSYK